MTYSLRYTEEAFGDFDRIYDFLIAYDIDVAEKAIDAIRTGLQLLADFPFSCRKASQENGLMRELLVPFGSSGYIVLFRIDGPETVTIAAVRHQREDDYH
ncbi:type II toxin-antitoxin system RelE/ParE family toxin [Agrobacterium tumefaciens]|uniref:Plasmid stabilization system protein ParE n=1 Tax=Agrobacterium tumefaciens TaxID=358 RepID=A0AAW8LSU8_AGRTU|nr:type II toxin-antitoxin system RelE/ParE family toxin [Agrobacterium tumefaciens]MBP2564161.1 plasmid stabilization system protein ParE [Agrobacterium tumefaciens]MDR6701976.1 plasmid stabilization system protein ParE [Agrobacterium tumefaciens]TCV55540.1 plasmid stabilization system protein ParE [Agrobacterium tumefaciens]